MMMIYSFLNKMYQLLLDLDCWEDSRRSRRQYVKDDVYCKTTIKSTFIYSILFSCYIQASDLTHTNQTMIKPPFRFDVEYFSLIAVFRHIYHEEKHQFKDEKERDSYVNRLKRSGEKFVTKKMIRQIIENGYYTITSEKPTVYLFIQNKQTKEIRACSNSNDHIPLDIKFYFKSTLEMYTYIRDNCNSHTVKMTNKGSLIIDYIEAQDVIVQIRIQSQPISLPQLQSFEELWLEAKQSWNMRKEPNYQQRQEIYEMGIKQGSISLFKKQQAESKCKEEKNFTADTNKFNFKPKKAKQVNIVETQQSSQDRFITQSSQKVKKDTFKTQPKQIYRDSKKVPIQSRNLNKVTKQPLVQPQIKKDKRYAHNDQKPIQNHRYEQQQQRQENASLFKQSQLLLINQIIKSKSIILTSLQAQAKHLKESIDFNAELQKKLLQRLDSKFNDFSGDMLLMREEIKKLSVKVNEIASNSLQSNNGYASASVTKKYASNHDHSNQEQAGQNHVRPSKSQTQKQAESKNKDFYLQQHQKLNQNLSKISSKKQNTQEKRLKKQKKRKE